MPIERILERSRAYEAAYISGGLSAVPVERIAVVTCMDARLRVFSILGIKEGDAHVIRNAGGVVTDDVVRSLVISQRLLNTEHVVLIHHTDCGMTKFTDDQMNALLREETGMKPSFSMESFADPAENVREGIARLKMSPFLPKKDSIHGFVFDVVSGTLQSVSPDAK